MKRLFLSFCTLCASISVSQAQIKEITNFADVQLQFDIVDTFDKNWMDAINNIYLYNNRVEYSKEVAPYPYKNGRILSGKYKSSNAAFNEYVNQLKSYKDKKYKFVKTVKINPVPEGIDRTDKGLLFVSEENDTILYWYSVLCSSLVEEGVEFTPLNVVSEIDDDDSDNSGLTSKRGKKVIDELEDFIQKLENTYSIDEDELNNLEEEFEKIISKYSDISEDDYSKSDLRKLEKMVERIAKEIKRLRKNN